MNISQRLRTCAKHTGLDAVIELLQEAADEIDRLSAGKAADVTDEQILEIAEPFGEFQYGDAQGDKRIDFARALLALRPVQVPMTDEERKLAAIDWSPCVRAAFNAGVKAAERHLGITAQTKKETP